MDYGWHFFCSWVSAQSVSLNNCCNTANTGVMSIFIVKKFENVWLLGKMCVPLHRN